MSEFLIHALKYEFPIKASRIFSVGMPTSYAAPVAADEFSFSGYVPVWPCSKGTVQGLSFEPVYPTVPSAAEADRGMYDRLAVFVCCEPGVFAPDDAGGTVAAVMVATEPSAAAVKGYDCQGGQFSGTTEVRSD